jgi:hypothetical protein
LGWVARSVFTRTNEKHFFFPLPKEIFPNFAAAKTEKMMINHYKSLIYRMLQRGGVNLHSKFLRMHQPSKAGHCVSLGFFCFSKPHWQS